MSNRRPSLVVPTVREPVKLERTIQQRLSRLVPSTGLLDSQDDAKAAREALERLRNDPTVPLDRRTTKALISLASQVESSGDRRLISRAVLSGAPPGWRHLWRLWVACHDDNPRVAMVLGQRLAQRVSARAKFADRLPAWLPRGPRDLSVALSHPEPSLRDYVFRNDVPLWSFHKPCEVPPTSRLGAHVAEDLVRQGPDYWWRSMNANSLRAWTSTQPTRVIAAVAERMLLDLGGSAQLPTQIANTADRPALKTWVLQECGDPAESPGMWSMMSPRAREVFEWLLVGDEIEKIFREFSRSAETARSDYWRRFIPQMRDARYYHAGETSVCMMVIGPLLAIEFGTTGNACYFYSAPSVPLRLLTFSRRIGASEFKVPRSRQGGRRVLHSLGQIQVEFNCKRAHTGGWKHYYDQILIEAGIRIPGQRSRM